MKQDEAVQLYIKLRDGIAAKKKAYEEDVAKDKSKMDKIEAAFLAALDKLGVESVNTTCGTAFKDKATSVTVADKDAFLGFVKEKGEWALMDVRASKTGVEQYHEANEGVLPPGINWREERVVRFRRPA